MQTPKFQMFAPQIPPLQSASRGGRPPCPFPPPPISPYIYTMSYVVVVAQKLGMICNHVDVLSRLFVAPCSNESYSLI